MARRIRHPSLESCTARFKLPIRGKPYRGPTLGRGERMDYRRNAGNGTWIAVGVGVNKKGKRGYWTKVTGRADDYDNADPAHSIYDYFQAIDAAKELIRGRGRGSDAATAGSSAPVTSKGSLKAYEADLASRHAGVYNARHALVHLTPELANKAVAQHDLDELKRWKLSLRGKIADSTINRICGSICAAFELSAQSDKRIQNHDAWRIGLARLPGVEQARNIVISDAKVREFITAAYARDAGLGLLIETLAETGARPSQASRLCVEDLRDRQPKPSLMLPKSGKGGGRNRSEKKQERYSVPISAQLARKLRQAAQGRLGAAPLLPRSDGRPWGEDASAIYREPVQKIVKAIGLDPAEVTVYALRHSNIVRMLLAGWPLRLVASLHDTSAQMIEANYSAHITEHAEDYAQVLLQPEEPAAGDNVVPMVR
jgi:integrase